MQLRYYVSTPTPHERRNDMPNTTTNFATMIQPCNGCDTVDYEGELDDAGRCAECATEHGFAQVCVGSDASDGEFMCAECLAVAL